MLSISQSDYIALVALAGRQIRRAWMRASAAGARCAVAAAPASVVQLGVDPRRRCAGRDTARTILAVQILRAPPRERGSGTSIRIRGRAPVYWHRFWGCVVSVFVQCASASTSNWLITLVGSSDAHGCASAAGAGSAGATIPASAASSPALLRQRWPAPAAQPIGGGGKFSRLAPSISGRSATRMR